jgi:hypothetical protein
MEKHNWEMYFVLEVPHASQVCPLTGSEVQLADFLCLSGIFIVISSESSLKPPHRYLGDSAATLFIFDRSHDATFTF